MREAGSSLSRHNGHSPISSSESWGPIQLILITNISSAQIDGVLTIPVPHSKRAPSLGSGVKLRGGGSVEQLETLRGTYAGERVQ